MATNFTISVLRPEAKINLFRQETTIVRENLEQAWATLNAEARNVLE